MIHLWIRYNSCDESRRRRYKRTRLTTVRLQKFIANVVNGFRVEMAFHKNNPGHGQIFNKYLFLFQPIIQNSSKLLCEKTLGNVMQTSWGRIIRLRCMKAIQRWKFYNQVSLSGWQGTSISRQSASAHASDQPENIRVSFGWTNVKNSRRFPFSGAGRKSENCNAKCRATKTNNTAIQDTGTGK